LDASEKRLQQKSHSLQQTHNANCAVRAAGQQARSTKPSSGPTIIGILAGTAADPRSGRPGAHRGDHAADQGRQPAERGAEERAAAGAEAIEIDGTAAPCRVIASTILCGRRRRIRIDDKRLTGHTPSSAIANPERLSKAVQFAGGVCAGKSDGGNVIVNNRTLRRSRKSSRRPCKLPPSSERLDEGLDED
jgi:hypothetical protein